MAELGSQYPLPKKRNSDIGEQSEDAAACRLFGWKIVKLCEQPLRQTLAFFQALQLTKEQKQIAGEVLHVSPTDQRAVVRGVNVRVRHQKQTGTQEGGLIRKEGTIHLSNIAIVDPSTNKPTRVGFKTLDDGRKVRIAKGSGERIDA